MPREPKAAKAERVRRILATLDAHDPDREISLEYDSAFQLLVATILSAQSTDAMVNKVTPALFAAYPTAQALAAAKARDVERIVHPCGYFRQKTRYLLGAARMVVHDLGGEVPGTMEELTLLPGVGRKTANVVLHNWFGRAEGVCVDTHVARLSRRLGLSGHDDPDRVERDLMALLPPGDWHRVTHLLIDHGRSTCAARRPDCAACVVQALCPSAFKVATPPTRRRIGPKGT